MEIFISKTKQELGEKAAKHGAKLIHKAIEANGEAYIIVATGASQFEMLNALVLEEVDWSKVSAFHLDEYIGLPENHPASFRKYLKDRFVKKVNLKAFNYVNGEGNPQLECDRLGQLISKYSIDVAFVGIGENAHLAFNDPPADFSIEKPYLVVKLDDKCRQQQMGEGWFESLEMVPKDAISMSIMQIMKSKAIVCTVPDLRKAEAIKATIEGQVNPNVPASILQNHANTALFLDLNSSSLLGK